MSDADRPLKQRAYSFLQVKEFANEGRIIRGIATTPTPDRVGDVVDPLGVKFQNPAALLWQHRHDQPVGTVKFEKPTSEGIRFEAEIMVPEDDWPASMKERVNEAWHSVKSGLVRAVSIGYREMAHEVLKGGGWKFTETEVFELSLVTIPANAEANIDYVRAFDTFAPKNSADPAPAASGKKSRVVKLSEPSRVREPFQLLHVKRP